MNVFFVRLKKGVILMDLIVRACLLTHVHLGVCVMYASFVSFCAS